MARKTLTRVAVHGDPGRALHPHSDQAQLFELHASQDVTTKAEAAQEVLGECAGTVRTLKLCMASGILAVTCDVHCTYVQALRLARLADVRFAGKHVNHVIARSMHKRLGEHACEVG